jgi:hypothetical protein
MMLKNEIKKYYYLRIIIYLNSSIKIPWKITSTIEMLLKEQIIQKTTIDLVKLTAVDKTADVLSSLISRLTVSIVLCCLPFWPILVYPYGEN